MIVTLALNPAIDVSSEAETVRSAHKVRTTNEVYDAGGGGVNVARAITALGGDVEVICLSGGVTGALLDELLARDNISRQLVKIAGNTRISFTVHEQATGLEYRFVATGPSVSAQELEACLAAIAKSDFHYFVASGSLPVGVPADFLATVAGIVAGKGAKFILDSSGPGLRETLARSSVYLVKPSLAELESLAGAKLDAQSARAAAVDLVARGAAEIVAVTMGPDGVLCASKDKVLRLPALKVEAQSTVGAGDSFLGAMTLALSQGKTLEASLVTGIAAGAAALLHPGTKLCNRPDFERLYEAAKHLDFI